MNEIDIAHFSLVIRSLLWVLQSRKEYEIQPRKSKKYEFIESVITEFPVRPELVELRNLSTSSGRTDLHLFVGRLYRK